MTIPLKTWNHGERLRSQDLNRIVEAIKRATPVAGNGIMVSQGIGGSVISLARGVGNAPAASGSAEEYPFELSLVKTGEHDYVAFRYVDGGLSVDGENAACLNNAAEIPADGTLRLVADEYAREDGVGSVSNLQVDVLEEGEGVDIYAVAMRMPTGYLYYLLVPSAIYTSTAPQGPDEGAFPQEDENVRTVLVGTVRRTGTVATSGEPIYTVTNQAVRSALVMSADGADAPWRLKVTDDGKLVIRLPSGCLQRTSSDAATIQSVDVAKNPRYDGDWYVVTDSATANYGSVWAHMDYGAAAFYVNFTACSAYDHFGFKVGKTTVADGMVAIEQYVSNAVVLPRIAGASGGNTVSVATNTTDAATTFATAGTPSQGNVPFTVYSKLADSAVEVGSGTLRTYLKGGAESYGTNLNTENFEDECLGSAQTPDEAPTPNVAAPSCHTHGISQLTSDEGEPLTAEDVISWFSTVGMYEEGLGDIDPMDPQQGEESLFLTVGDVETDASKFKPDSATPSAGAEGDLLSLSGHRHPLNLKDAEPVPEGGQPPAPESYVLPVGTATTGSGQSATASPTAAAFGSDNHYARVDHIHPICAEMAAQGATAPTEPTMTGMNLKQAETSLLQLDQTEWTPGSVGLWRVTLSRVVKGTDMGTEYADYCYWIFRKEKYSRTGALIYRGPEYCAFRTSI